jgi:hypothetical protein
MEKGNEISTVSQHGSTWIKGFGAKMKSQNKRRRGAQPGNTNALKHGFYSRRFTAGDREDLEARLSEGVSDEIAMLRVIVRRMFNATLDSGTPDQPGQDLEQLSRTINTLSIAAIRIGNLLKLQQMLGTKEDDPNNVIRRALTDIAKELKLQV